MKWRYSSNKLTFLNNRSEKTSVNYTTVLLHFLFIYTYYTVAPYLLSGCFLAYVIFENLFVCCIKLDTFGAFYILLRNCSDTSMWTFLLETTTSSVGLLPGFDGPTRACFASPTNFDDLFFSSHITRSQIALSAIKL